MHNVQESLIKDGKTIMSYQKLTTVQFFSRMQKVS